jgi:alkylation response protein AidB-like acyl-CoA dehydrogenase
MAIGITEEHEALARSARRFLESRCPPAVPRALLDAADEGMPPFWVEMAGLGWLGLHVPEASGGQGYGFSELAIVLEELGRAAAPGPFLPTVLASAAIVQSDPADPLLAALAGGTLPAALAWDGTLIATTAPGGGVILDGTLGPVLGAGLAQLIVLPAGGAEGRERWYAVDADQLTISPLKSLDPTRGVATVSADHVVVGAERELAGLDRAAVRTVVAALVGAECAGGAGWCLDTAAAYAKVREQFGRPIGQFQAVKHRCADMLVAVEQARSAAWDTAAALDDGTTGPGEVDLSAAVAGALGPDAFVRVAKDCIQILGGVGFTWEHDAHLYLKRATAVRQLLGGAGPWRATAATLALSGVRRHLGLELPKSAAAFRDEVRDFAGGVQGLDASEQRRRVVDAGYFAPHWPPPFGRNAGAVEQLVVDQEFRRARIRRPNLAVGAWAAPTIVAHGTPEQQERWVRPTLTGEISWCQMFSEPGAGSDLASLATKAVRTDGGWLLSGQKVWTSMAKEADWAICLARTSDRSRSVAKHHGITYFLIDMTSPGLDIRPLRELTGFAMFNEIFLSDVFVPDDCVVGDVDLGWPLARTTLANERVAMGSGSSFGGGVEALLGLVGSMERPSGGLDPLLADRLGALLAEAQSVALLGLRSTARALSGAAPGPESSVRKLLGVEHDQRVQEFGLELLGPQGATTEGQAAQWSFGFLANRCLTIAGGTSEVQRNVIAERLLGLPRDPEPAG